MDGIFDEILDLEGNFYTEGYDQGWADGLVSGRMEGRSLGMERGFDKFFEAGLLYGKSLVWANRLPSQQGQQQPHHNEGSDGEIARKQQERRIPPLPKSQRLEKNITALHDLMQPDTLPTQNTDENVQDVDDRIRKARGKTRIIERAVGEISAKGGSDDEFNGPAGKNENIEDSRNIKPIATTSS